MAEKHWVEKAIRRPGQLHRDLGVPEGAKIPQDALRRAIAGQYGPATKRRAVLARTMKGWHK